MNEVHINDPDFFQDICRTDSKFLKDKYFYRGISAANSSIGFVDPTKHHIRRQLLAPTFSSKRVQEISPRIQEKAKLLATLLEDRIDPLVPVNIPGAVKCFTLDIISGLIFGEEFELLGLPALNILNPRLYVGILVQLGYTEPILSGH